MSNTPSTPPTWLLSFTDVIALMLTFFVLLYAMSDPDPIKFEKKIGITQSAEGNFNNNTQNSGNNEGENIDRIDYQAAENLDYLQILIEDIFKKHPVRNQLSLRKNNEAIIVVSQNLNYKSNVKKYNFYNDLFLFLNRLDNQIIVTANDNISFTETQKIGRFIRNLGYERPIILSTASQSYVPRSGFAILIKPDSGTRIE